MKLRLECYDGERDAALARIRGTFPVKSVSKGYPNARQTASEGTPCESRYYIELSDGACKGPDMALEIAADMLRLLAILRDKGGYDPGPELAGVKAFYDKAPSMTDLEKTRLAAEWRAAVLGRFLKKGGVSHA